MDDITDDIADVHGLTVYNRIFTPPAADLKLRFYDFFAGAGLVTMGLRNAWQCVWANDIDPRKEAVYRANFGDVHFVPGDVAQVTADQLPSPAEMAWASFPCQDLSLAHSDHSEGHSRLWF